MRLIILFIELTEQRERWCVIHKSKFFRLMHREFSHFINAFILPQGLFCYRFRYIFYVEEKLQDFNAAGAPQVILQRKGCPIIWFVS
jgi:hypothetical protein